MYRQFKVADSDVNFQRIVWRESPDDPIEDYKLLTVTYGTASAPYLATRCLKQLAIEESNRFPKASKVIHEDMNVDDVMSGEDSPEDAILLQKEISKLLQSGGMKICKWATNNPLVLESIPPESRESQLAVSLDIEESLKALGGQWNPSTDQLMFAVSPIESHIPITKRKLLSELAKVFDPLGWLTPVTVKAKMIFQDLWRQQTSWDEELCDAVQRDWQTYQNDLYVIRNINIPRCIIVPNVFSYQFHGFSDASERAYAAAVYLRCVKLDGSISVNLVAAKSKVSPIRQVSIPRLGLCGAVLLANLLVTIKRATRIDSSIHAWTDSTIVLRWLESYPGRWKTFVANRVAEIQELVPRENWNHVISEQNPADLPSRGVQPEFLSQSSLWWSGPSWLSQETFPQSSEPVNPEIVEAEAKTKELVVGQTSVDCDSM